MGGVAVGAEQQATAEPVRRSRREVTRGLLGSAAALAMAPVVAASRPLPTAGPGDAGAFDETYRGRRIQGVRVSDTGRRLVDGVWQITVDGRPLHLMRRADGTWLSIIDHYTSYRTPLEATRAAVDELGPDRQLRDLAPDRFGGGYSGVHPGGHTGKGGQHGVRA
ncbi:tyrosinase family oxidase copper chaperone [Streptomyces sp. Caat 7-52]|uniref:tyrosinase family oxidase copper chaperone n=1 Tax=Streptomyces sp. Caat 7-52 TaxID=2949637 RepID=UPI003336FE1E